MDLLLDTCAFIWLCSEPEKYEDTVGETINKAGNLYLSDASIFEMAVKHASGKLSLPETPRKWIHEQLTSWNIASLPLIREVIFLSAELPLHHIDPFDRLIIATAINRKLPVVSSDTIFDKDDIKRLPVKP